MATAITTTNVHHVDPDAVNITVVQHGGAYPFGYVEISVNGYAVCFFCEDAEGASKLRFALASALLSAERIER
jgi:hypothetical protein